MMPNKQTNTNVIITFPDGRKADFKSGITGIEIAQSISPSLAKRVVLIKINGKLCDVSLPIIDDAKIELLDRNHQDVLEVLRHDTAHLMAEAVKELFPDTQVTIGPAIENGFYYDFARKTPFTPEDLVKIETRMHDIVDRKEEIIRKTMPREEAITFFSHMGEAYKAEIIQSIPEGEVISLYQQGDFIDLCRGPHLPHTGHIGHAFKLMKIAGAYWRGDAKNEMLQRVYGTVWPSEAALKDYLFQLEEAERRDHRKLGKEMHLFHQQEESPGNIFWHAKGWTLYRLIEEYIRDLLQKNGYFEVKTPMMVDRSLWEASGHWQKFREHMFTIQDEEKVYALKPMNCPCHVQIYRQGLKSYRDLPLRMAEFGSCHRNEPSGSLQGIMRVRAFTQDDAHIFCTEDQITEETVVFCQLLMKVYQDFGFDKVEVKFSDRPEIRAGDDSIWDKAEQALKLAVEQAGLHYTLNPGEGAFYGPKLEFVLKDAIGRSWQCGTLQVDFVLPERLEAHYIAEDGTKQRPVMLHRAILGSLERFIGILIEHYAGHFPLWLAPQQVMILSVISDVNDYAQNITQQLQEVGLRVGFDGRNEKISYKIREHSLAKIPVMLIIGAKEKEQNQVTLRIRGNEAQQTMAVEEATKYLRDLAKKPLS